jgi:hypothetical protein
VTDLQSMVVVLAVSASISVLSWLHWQGALPHGRDHRPHRNPFYRVLPAGLAGCCLAIAGIIGELTDAPSNVMFVLLVPAFVLSTTFILLHAWRPRWLRPEWQLEIERDIDEGRRRRLEELAAQPDLGRPVDALDDIVATESATEAALAPFREERERLTEEGLRAEVAAIEAAQARRNQRRRGPRRRRH